jgi:hypothetical protein
VLRGTGQNFLLQSNTFNTTWTTASSTVATTVATLDPFGGSNAWLVTASASGAVGITQTLSLANLSSTYTLSVYAKAGTSTWLRLFTSNVSPFAWFNLSTGVVGTVQSGATATITSVGNGWYRCSISSVSNNTIGIRLADADNNTQATSGTALYLYGAQVELASSVGTYTATTTTAVYGTPTLSFSGVSTIGLESNGALFLQPAGTGALQAQATTSTTAGGNARGANAVDWQTFRTAAAQVASGSYATVNGGAVNTASSTFTVVSGGNNNIASGFGSSINGGNSNISSGSYSAVSGGGNNTVTNLYGYIGGGNLNTCNGVFNFVGGGFTNSGTASAAVTTQSGTMNGTTAVTLSGSNANIRVGQFITGTSIASDTYVAAISGTSLTLSKVASGSSTSTLSFFTPHGVVVGGGNNQATGSYSFIGGGGDAGTAANRNVASGDWSFVGGGRANQSTGLLSTISGGLGNLNSAGYTFIGGGLSNSASGFASSILGGYFNNASGAYSTVISGSLGTTRSITSSTVLASSEAITFGAGLSQTAVLVLARQTTDATATALTSNTSAASTTNQVILPNNSAYFFTGEVVSGVTGGGNTKGWTIEGVIKRGANAASTALVGTPTVTSMYADVGAATWTIAVTADTTNGGIRVTFTGQAGTTIRTVCQIRTTEMTY